LSAHFTAKAIHCRWRRRTGWEGVRAGTDAKSQVDEITLGPNSTALKLRLSYVGKLAHDDVLLLLIEGDMENDNRILESSSG
jgi:hypothetical protein